MLSDFQGTELNEQTPKIQIKIYETEVRRISSSTSSSCDFAVQFQNNNLVKRKIHKIEKQWVKWLS